MKVCIISSADFNEQYGSTTRAHSISQNLAKLGCNILHFCNYPSKNKEKNIKYLTKKKAFQKNFLKNMIYVYTECKKFSPDILYPHQPNNAGRAVLLKYLLGVPLIYDAHSSYLFENNTLKNRILERIIVRISDKIIVPSDEIKKLFINIYNVSTEKLIVIKNGVDIQRLKPSKPDEALRKKIGLSNNDKVVIFTCPRIPSFPSNIIALKYFFELIPRIEARIKNIKFIIIGGGKKLKSPSSNVIYTGYVSEIERYINIGDVCVAPFPPSAVCGGTRTKLSDYFACGKPVISTEEGIRGFDDVIPNKNFLLAIDDEDFINKLEYVLLNVETSKKIGMNARKLMEEKYDWSKLSKLCFYVLQSSIKPKL